MPIPTTNQFDARRPSIGSAAWRVVVCGILMLAAGRAADAQSASQVVNFRVLGQSRAVVSPVAKPITLHSASASMANGTFTLTTNEANQKIVASIDRAMPAGSSLSAALGATATGISAGMQRLDMSATDVVTQIAPTDSARLPISYSIIGAPADGQRGGGEQRLVTYTLIAGP